MIRAFNLIQTGVKKGIAELSMFEMKNLQTDDDEVEKMEEDAALFHNTYTSILDLIQVKVPKTYPHQSISADITPPTSSQSSTKRNLSQVGDQSSRKRRRSPALRGSTSPYIHFYSIALTFIRNSDNSGDAGESASEKLTEQFNATFLIDTMTCIRRGFRDLSWPAGESKFRLERRYIYSVLAE